MKFVDDLLEDGGCVCAVRSEGIVTARRPFAIAVATEVDRNRPHAGFGDAARSGVPGATRLAATMQEHDRMAASIPEVRLQAVAFSASKFERNRLHVIGCSLRNSITRALKVR